MLLRMNELRGKETNITSNETKEKHNRNRKCTKNNSKVKLHVQ